LHEFELSIGAYAEHRQRSRHRRDACSSRTASGWMLAVTSMRHSIDRESSHITTARVGALDQRRLAARRVDRIDDDAVRRRRKRACLR
jgi:hypothetical protein